MWLAQVVNRATIGGNQSERSRFCISQSESSIWHTWPKWRGNAHIWSWKFTWPHGKKNTHRQELDPHCSHSFNEHDACAVWPKTFTMRSHVNGVVGPCADRQNTPQVSHIRMSLFPRRPTTHAQTTKISPSPLASLEVHEKYTVLRSTSTFFLMTISNGAWWQVGRVWRPSDVTPMRFNKWT